MNDDECLRLWCLVVEDLNESDTERASRWIPHAFLNVPGNSAKGASGKAGRQPQAAEKAAFLFTGVGIFNRSRDGKMADWSDDESDFTEQIAMMAMMGMQRVVQLLEEEEEGEGVVNSQPRTRQPIPRDRVGAHNRLVGHYFAPQLCLPTVCIPASFSNA
ncbi:hypothetical protein LXL04_021925 [Taraxacum kok-saghyz]